LHYIDARFAWHYYAMSFHFTVLAVALLLLITSNVTLLSEYGDVEAIGNNEKWFMFTEDEEKVIEEYIATRSVVSFGCVFIFLKDGCFTKIIL
jgi:hypothetical protein